MKPILCLALLSTFLVTEVHGFFFDRPGAQTDPGQALYLSPYIAKGEIRTAQSLSKVGPLKGTTVMSYSGYITVNKQYNSNLFFWFVPAQHADPNKTSTILWLDGGPGVSSLFGLFVQNGPWNADKDLNLVPRSTAWSNKYNVLYIDQPVGTGFSFTENDAGYAVNEDDVARDLYNFLMQFFSMFPNIQKTDLYITGQSYAGKYVPAICFKIHMANPTAQLKMNLKGILIGGPFTDPVSIIPTYPDYLFKVGVLDEKETMELRNRTSKTLQLIHSKQFKLATKEFQAAFQLITNFTGYKTFENLLYVVQPPDMLYFKTYVQQAEIRHAIHAGNLSFDDPSFVAGGKLAGDFTDSVKDWFVTLLNSNKYKILLYNGQEDIIVCAPATRAMLKTMTAWTHYSSYLQAEKKIWRLNPHDIDVAGYVRVVGNFTHVIVRGAGHIVPHDKPERAYDMFTRYMENKPF